MSNAHILLHPGPPGLGSPMVVFLLLLGSLLGPPAIGALSHPFLFLVGRFGSPAKIDRTSWYPYSNLSTGGLRLLGQHLAFAYDMLQEEETPKKKAAGLRENACGISVFVGRGIARF